MVCYEGQACQLFKFSMSRGPFAALIIESTQKRRISRDQRGLIYFLPKIVQWAKFEAKLFPMRNALDRSNRDRPLSLVYFTS